MAGKFQIKSRKWDIGVLIGSVVTLALGLGGLFLLQSSGNAAGGTTNLFVIFLGIVTFAFFAGPGLVYVLRKRVKKIKDLLPGGSMTWIRSHLYLPILALVAAYAHAQSVPFRGALTSGKVLLVLGILVSVGGMARHHLIGIQKAALNVNVAVGKLTTGQPRPFRRLVADYTDHKRSREEVDAAMAQFDPALQEKWRKITEISDEVEKHFPRAGGQKWHIRQYKLWRALHPPLTIALFLVLAFHVWDVTGGTRAVAGEENQFAAASECADCHGPIFDDWASSTMSHAATSTVNEGQLPITLSENGRIIAEFDGSDSLELLTGRDLDDASQEDLVLGAAQVCIDCHTPVGGSFTQDPLALLPFGGDNDVLSLDPDGEDGVSGNAAVTSDGVGCVTCHMQESAPGEIAGAIEIGNPGSLDVSSATGGGFGTMFGPIFEDPNPLPVRIHGIETPEGDDDGEGFWRNDLETSQLCGACHNVKLDIDGDGVDGTVVAGIFEDDDVEEQDILAIIDAAEGDDPLELDADGDFQMDENELDDDRIQTENGAVNENIDNDADGEADGGDGLIDDLVLQTTYDEWQDYVYGFDAEPDEVRGHDLGGFTDRYEDAEFPSEVNAPLGCNGCHMPFSAEGVEGPVVDYAPGLLPTPDRFTREHTFVGVDYDLDPELYRKNGLSDEDIAQVVAERDALIQSAVTLAVESGDPVDAANGGTELPVGVTVRNNLLAHAFPTGFAFARQFWLEVSAVDGDGNPVCLAPAFFDADTGEGTEGINQPCGSGFGDVEGTDEIDGDVELRQCDTRAVAETLGFDPDVLRQAGGVDADSGIIIPNLDIDFAGDSTTDFAGSFAPDECDPWLVNFQKILTDGDPDGNGIRSEVPYQPLLPDAVKIRGQVATGQSIAELQPVRVRDNDGDGVVDDSSQLTVQYFFTVPDGVDPADIVVTARMRFRHSPPYFIRDLQNRQEALGDDGVPEGARMDADALLSHMVVGEVGFTTTLDCVDDDEVADVLERLDLRSGGGGGDEGDDDGFSRDEEGLGVPTGGELALFGPLGIAVLIPVASTRRRLGRLHRRR
jgi:cytochrome c553